MEEPTELKAIGLKKSYNGRQVVKGIDLSLKTGEIVGMLGPNGAGKTTCFYMVSGLIAVDEGSIFLDQRNITYMPMYRRARLGVGYLPQESSIFRGLTVEQNIMAILELHEEDPDKRQQLLNDLLAEFSISHLRNAASITLSGGERRRLEIARAVACNPSFILLDEPLAGVDPIAVLEIKQLISHLRERGLGILITDHNVRELLDVVDRAYIVNEGVVIMSGTPEEITSDSNVRNVYLGHDFKL